VQRKQAEIKKMSLKIYYCVVNLWFTTLFFNVYLVIW